MGNFFSFATIGRLLFTYLFIYLFVIPTVETARQDCSLNHGMFVGLPQAYLTVFFYSHITSYFLNHEIFLIDSYSLIQLSYRIAYYLLLMFRGI